MKYSVNIIVKWSGKTPNEDCRPGLLQIKPEFKLMMGSLEAEIAKMNNISVKQPEIDVENYETYIEKALAEIQKHIEEYEIKVLNPSRTGKNLLVLDIDNTLWDSGSLMTKAQLPRPYLHEFLTSAYEDYDIVIWSATAMKYIQDKINLLGISNHTNYKIMFCLDERAMIRIDTKSINIKPLGIIWGKFEQYNSKNTIMIDDIRENFLMNLENGIKVNPYKKAHINVYIDTELLFLSKYLKDLALDCNDFSTVNHDLWKSFIPERNDEKS